MKKILMVTFAALLLFSLVACSAPAGTPQESAPPSPDAEASGDANLSEGQENGETLFGKVKSLVGNEVSLDLAKTPTEGLAGAMAENGGFVFQGGDGSGGISVTRSDEATGSSESEEGGGEGGGEGGDTASGSSKSSSVVIAAEGEDGQAQVFTPSESGDMPKMELEYTGEAKDFTIPAGLPITDLFGNELKASELKEGNVLMVSLGQDGSISSILVME